MIALELAHADRALPLAGAQIEGESQHLEFPEGVDMRAVARHHLREHVLGDERCAAHVVDAKLHVGALVVGVVQARNHVGDAEQAACDLRDHEVRVVELRDGRDDIAVVHTRLHEGVLVEADALQRGAVEVAAEVRECVGAPVDHADVTPVVGKHVGELRAHAPAPYHNDIAHKSPFAATPFRCLA